MAAVGNLVKMYKDEPESRFFLLEYLTEVDPHGRALPDIVVEQITQSPEPIGESVREWSAFAGHYHFNSGLGAKSPLQLVRQPTNSRNAT